MELQLIFVSFIAGVLTILAPCIFPLLPILIGSSADGKADRNRAFTVIGSLLVSITVLTLLIHGTSNFFNIDASVRGKPAPKVDIARPANSRALSSIWSRF